MSFTESLNPQNFVSFLNSAINVVTDSSSCCVQEWNLYRSIIIDGQCLLIFSGCSTSVTLDGATELQIKLYVVGLHVLRRTAHFLLCSITSLATKYCSILSMYVVKFSVAWLNSPTFPYVLLAISPINLVTNVKIVQISTRTLYHQATTNGLQMHQPIKIEYNMTTMANQKVRIRSSV